MLPIIVFILSHFIPPAPLGSTLDTGVVMIPFENIVKADTVVATLGRADCPIAARAPIEYPDSAQAIVQVPDGPPFNEPCLLRPGDHLYLQLYRAGDYIDEIGPYRVPYRIWLPAIQQPIQ